MIHSKQHRGCRLQDPGTRGKHQTTTKNPWFTSRGCRVQNLGPWDPWLPVVENSRVSHSAAQPTVRPPNVNTRHPNTQKAWPAPWAGIAHPAGGRSATHRSGLLGLGMV